MVKPTFKIISLIFPVMLLIGLLRVLFGADGFLPSADRLMVEFNKFPSMKDEVNTLIDWSNGLSEYSSSAWDSIPVLWNNIKDLGDFFTAVGLTIVRFFAGLGSMIASVFSLVAIVPAMFTYPIQCVVWLLGVLTFAPA